MLTLIEGAELEALRNASRKAITGILEDAEFYYDRAEKMQDAEQKQKSQAAAERRRLSAESLSAYIHRLEQLVQQAEEAIPLIKSNSYANGYEAGQRALVQRNNASQFIPSKCSAMERETKRMELQAWNRQHYGESTEGLWKNGEYIGSDKKIKKRVPKQ